MDVDAPVAFLGKNYSAYADSNPCDGCSAPCCRIVLSAQNEPSTFSALDRLRYLVAHRNTELVLDRRGHWQLLAHNPCGLLDEHDRCSVHGTPAKPKICVNYDPHGCWYKRNFHEPELHGGAAPDLIRMDLAAFERILETILFDDLGRITHIPPYDELEGLAAGPG